MSKRWMLLLSGCALAAPLHATSDAATRFGMREDIRQISLSPDGTTIAYIEPIGARGDAVFVIKTSGGTPVRIATSSGDPERLRACRWSTNTRLVCAIYMTLDSGADTLGYSRILAVDSDGRNAKVLSARDSSDATARVMGGGNVIDWAGEGTILMARWFVPLVNTGNFRQNDRDGLGVDRVDTRSAIHVTVEQPNTEARDFITDGTGTVRIKGMRGSSGVGYDSNVTSYLYRPVDSHSWQPLSTVTQTSGRSVGFDPIAVDHAKNLAYGFEDYQGHTALYSIALDGSDTHRLVLAHRDVDIDDLIRIGRQQRIVGASYATDRRQIEFFDPELKKLAASLGKALPGLPLISFVDASADEQKLLLFAGSDVDPGRYYLYDKTTRRLDQVTPARPQLAEIKLASVQAVTFPGADGVQIPAYLTLPPGGATKGLPTIVMPHGGPSSRDEWGFDWFAQFFANRGFAVLQPEYRGSSGYGDAWFKDNGFKSWRTAIGDVNAGGSWLVKQGIADPAHIAIVGWSYGGYAALQSAVLDPGLFKAIVAVATVTDLETLRDESLQFSNHALAVSFIGTGPHLREGSPAQNAARITAPVLLFHGDHDQNVGIGESRLMATRLKAAGKSIELVEFKRLDHQLDDSSARAEMLDTMDGFLRTSLHLPPAP